MNTLTELHCPECQSLKTEPFKKYNTVHNGKRRLLKCDKCGNVFSETVGTPMQDIKSPISKVASVLKIRSEGMEPWPARLYVPIPADSTWENMQVCPTTSCE